MGAVSYATFGPEKFGMTSGQASNAQTETKAIPSPSPADPEGNLLHPGNPMVAFGVILGVVFGAIAFSTSFRVGKSKASLTIGDPK